MGNKGPGFLELHESESQGIATSAALILTILFIQFPTSPLYGNAI